MHRIIPVAALAVGLVVPALAQEAPAGWQGSGQVTGTVVDEDGDGIRDADVKLRFAEAGEPPEPEPEPDQPSRAAAMAAATTTASSAAPPPERRTSTRGWWPVLRTDRDGAFIAQGLAPGRWVVQIEAKDRTRRRAVVQVEEGGSASVNVSLGKPLSNRDLSEMQEQLEAGNQLFLAGDFGGARSEFEQVLAARPEFMPIHRSIAFTYGKEGDHAKALEHLELALAEDAGNVELLILTVQSAVEVGDSQKTAEYIDALFDTEQENGDMLAQVAVILLQAKKGAEAVGVLDRVIRAFPNDANPYYFRAMAMLQGKKVPEAKADLEKFIAVAPPDHPQRAQAEGILSKLP